MEASDNFFQDILKERVITIKSIKDFDLAKFLFKRKLIVTLDISLELVRMANNADELIKKGLCNAENHSILLSASYFNLKYIDVISLEQIENLKEAFQKINENKIELMNLCPTTRSKKIYNKDYQEDNYIELKKETLLNKIKNKVKKIFGKKTIAKKFITEIFKEKNNIEEIIQIPNEKVFTPTSKEIWHYYTSINKDKYYYQIAQEWGTILEYIIDFEKLKNFNQESVNKIIDISIKKSLELKTFIIERSDVERVFSILKINWKYGFLLESWQEEQHKVKAKTKGNY